MAMLVEQTFGVSDVNHRSTGEQIELAEAECGGAEARVYGGSDAALKRPSSTVLVLFNASCARPERRGGVADG
jgi:hypothetical protein